MRSSRTSSATRFFVGQPEVRARYFPGWRIVAIAFFSCFVSVGIVSYSYGVFFNAIMADLDGTRLAISTGVTALNLATAVTSPFLGRVMDREGARRVMCFGAVMLALGFALASQVSQIWQFYLVFGTLMGAAVPMLGPLATSTLVANWFVVKRGKALAYSTMGISAAGMVVPWCMTRAIAGYGWRFAFEVCAVLAAFVLLPVLFFGVVGRPEDVGLLADGARTPSERGDQAGVAPVPLPTFRMGEAVRSRNFVVIAVVVALNACCMQGVITHLVPFLVDRGWSGSGAALGLSLLALFALLARPVFGQLVDRLPMRTVLMVVVALQALGLLTLLGGGAEARRVVPGVILFALGVGCLMPMQGALIGAAFGRPFFGRIMGVMSPAMFPIINVGVPLAGWLHDRTGNYGRAFQVFLAFYGLSAVTAGFLRLPRPETAFPSSRA